jgi:16S rRNA processing protein RimM
VTVRDIVIGEVVRAHGLRGWVRVRATGPTLDGVAVGETLQLTVGGATKKAHTVLGVDGVPPRMLLLLSEVGDRTTAEALAGAIIRVPDSRLDRDLDEDTFYVTDLLGYTVTIGDQPAGVVRDVHTGRGNDVLEVGPEGPAGEAVLVPFTRDAIVDFDRSTRRITVRGDLL